MKKSVVLLIIGTLLTFKGFGQMADPIRWSYTAKKTSKNEALITITAKLDKGWHLYSQYVKTGGPQPTQFKYEKSNFKIALSTSMCSAIQDQLRSWLLRFLSLSAVCSDVVFDILINEQVAIAKTLDLGCIRVQCTVQ